MRPDVNKINISISRELKPIHSKRVWRVTDLPLLPGPKTQQPFRPQDHVSRGQTVRSSQSGASRGHQPGSLALGEACTESFGVGWGPRRLRRKVLLPGYRHARTDVRMKLLRRHSCCTRCSSGYLKFPAWNDSQVKPILLNQDRNRSSQVVLGSSERKRNRESAETCNMTKCQNAGFCEVQSHMPSGATCRPAPKEG